MISLPAEATQRRRTSKAAAASVPASCAPGAGLGERGEECGGVRKTIGGFWRWSQRAVFHLR
jgi:hypothetical protein